MSKAKVGVTLYSFSTEYCKGLMSLEDCIRTAKELGAQGFEIVATQMIPSYPIVSDKFLGEFKAMCSHYDIEPVSYGANCDKGLCYDRSLTGDEMVAMAVQDIKNANRLGCHILREQYLIVPENFKKLLPYCEAYDVKVGIEIHNPDSPITPMTQGYLDVIYTLVSIPYGALAPVMTEDAAQRNTMIIGYIGQGLSLIVIYLLPFDNIPAIVAANGLFGFFNVAFPRSPGMIADAIDLHEYEAGVRSECGGAGRDGRGLQEGRRVLHSPSKPPLGSGHADGEKSL